MPHYCSSTELVASAIKKALVRVSPHRNFKMKCSFIDMDMSLLEQKRKSHIEKGEIYFWTATTNQWKRLLENDEYKDVIIDSLQYLTDSGKIDVFAFIIMPNHIHLLWRVNEPNGKESPQGSLLKYTAHLLKKKLQKLD